MNELKANFTDKQIEAFTAISPFWEIRKYGLDDLGVVSKKESIKEDPKDIKTVYDVILVFADYKNRLDKYHEIDGKIVYDRFGKELTAKIVADKLIARGILVEIKSAILH